MTNKPNTSQPWLLAAISPYTLGQFRDSLEREDVIVFSDDRSIIVVQDKKDGDCEWHWFFEPKLPAKEKKGRIKAAACWLIAHGFTHAVGLTPEHMLAARIWATYIGAKNMGKRDGGVVYLVNLKEWTHTH